MKQIDVFCGFAKTEKKTSNKYVIADIVLAVISLVLIILIIVTITKTKSEANIKTFTENNLMT